VCGGPGGLEPFEFDDRAVYEAYKAAAIAMGLGDLVERIEAGYLEDTPGGGIHWMYRLSHWEEVKPPTKLAERPDATCANPKGRKPLIETKGRGGFIIVAPSCGMVHPSGRAYRLLRGGPETIATITADERDALWELARTFDEMPPKSNEWVGKSQRGQPARPGEVRPGDAYAEAHTWEDILEPLGWTKIYTRADEVTYWRRPDKDIGISATVGFCKGLYVFTTSTSFEARRSYTKFGVYACVNHGGDFAAAARDLAGQGYGTTSQPRPSNGVDPDRNGQHQNGDAGDPEKTPRKGVVFYHEEDGCLYGGYKRLANFTARIVRTITRHEGGSERIRYEVRARHSGGREHPPCFIEAEKYSSLSWVYNLGAEFAIEPGREIKDLARHGIQVLSYASGIAEAVEHTSTGWVRHDGQWVYRHAGGAIGADGPCKAISVDLAGSLSGYRLPEMAPDRATLAKAMEAHCDLWGLAEDGRQGGRGVAAVAATLPWRAVLGAFNASVHLGGPSGNFKTSMARVLYQHFADIRGRNHPMPADWRSTLNALQRLAFDCGDSLLIVDDLKLAEHVKTAEILMQSQGNLQSRLRMNADQSLQHALNPRGALLSTGEIDPRTPSTLGRVLMVEIRAGDIDPAVLSRLQQAGDEGRFSALMAAFVRWLAGRLDDVREMFRRRVVEIGQGIGAAGVHQRHPDIIAQLRASYEVFHRFAGDLKLIPPVNSMEQLDTAKTFLGELLADQAGLQEESKPGRRFLDLIASALNSGRCHLDRKDPKSLEGDYLLSCGWRTSGKHDEPYRIPSGSRCIGYVDRDAGSVYLDPNESVMVADELARAQHIPQSFDNIGRELLSEGLAEGRMESGKLRAAEKIRIPGGSTIRCFRITWAVFFGTE
jgi:hypothetical protein